MKALAILAHPDDETLFLGGTILSCPNYVWRLICVTYSASSDRAQEMLQAIDMYRESVPCIDVEFLGQRDAHREPGAGLDLSLLRVQLSSLESWPDLIITHNERGEYGHVAHQIIHSLVGQIFPSIWSIEYPTDEKPSSRNFKGYWNISITEVIRSRKSQIFNTCYLSQQHLWTKMPTLMTNTLGASQESFAQL